jgi:hypothetical protein
MSAELLARGATPLNPRGARNSARERAQTLARGTTPLDSRQGGVRRIRDEARDGLSAAAISLAGSVAVTAAVWLVLQWLG